MNTTLRQDHGDAGSFMERLAGRIVLLEGLPRVALTVLAGAVAALALPPLDFPAAALIAFPCLVWLLDGVGARRSLLATMGAEFATGWLFGFGYFVAGLWWMGSAMLVDAAAFAVFIPFAVLGLPAILGIYFGLAAVLARRFWGDNAWRILSLAASLALFEYLRSFLFTGFPWNEIGVLAAPTPMLMQSTSLVGVHGLTLVAVIVFASPAALADRSGRFPVLLLALILAAAHVGYGAYRLDAHPTVFAEEDVHVSVVQANIPQAAKFDEAQAETIFAKQIELSNAGRRSRKAATGGDGSQAGSTNGPAIIDAQPPGRTLIVWPESSLPFILTERPEAIARLADMIQPGETLIAGAPRLEIVAPGDERIYNSVLVINDQGEIIDARDKVHLVPFGEYMPYGKFFDQLGIMNLSQMPGGFSAGTLQTKVALDGAPGFLALICYEAIFPAEIAAAVSADRPDFIVNDTNDGWFGRTSGPYQHLRLAKLSSVALGLPLVRAANTGISVVTDGYGREIDALALGATGTIEAKLPAAAPPTPYSRLRNLPFFAMLIATFVVAIIGCSLLARRRAD
ncbi:apolipoprotein N-acyltransferase [Jiella marina]|uniref:apolipoprotein N-acyltransferase n=1 Tax=Jiella sp. LLJ827 TaxID=2917712 RepID=UPI0021013763|nr:apolipoprotein N-acyltransferase [Jiella sp. LLJ827]MCQ0988589.1 apolipoprotein N-acyltransferase [Jiella sp. LLJ827]